MIQIENVEVVGWEAAIRGMRNPMNSWDKSDSYSTFIEDEQTMQTAKFEHFVGDNDYELMARLAEAGSDHSKYLRMIAVYADVTAPRYWWAEYDTYKVGTVRNSCSTMHKIQAKEFTLNDFSCEHLAGQPLEALKFTILCLNNAREYFLDTKNKEDWWQMIQLLPNSYNQRATVMLNYEVLRNMYHSRKNHKLDEWRDLCKWIESLPYSKLITT